MSEISYFRVVKVAEPHPEKGWLDAKFLFAWITELGEGRYFEPAKDLQIFCELFFDCYWRDQLGFDHRWSSEDRDFVKMVKIPTQDYDNFCDRRR